jgi:hypothetical protein
MYLSGKGEVAKSWLCLMLSLLHIYHGIVNVTSIPFNSEFPEPAAHNTGQNRARTTKCQVELSSSRVAVSTRPELDPPPTKSFELTFLDTPPAAEDPP